ncbi:MAG: ABC transporter ATP-binding protein [Bacilli bacterium]|nr:ABC transporter ATP-binding protein [Bacilli bacterium]
MSNKLLSVKNLEKYFHDKTSETKALDDITFDLYEQEFISIVGPSGCGKSTILSILSYLEDPSNGEFKYSKDITIGYMLQDDSLFEWRTILDNCLIGLEINNNLNKETKAYVINLLKTYGLGDFINKYPSSLSGGMRQRVALIRTLAINPDILLLDEPMSKLDYQSRLAISDDIYKIIKKEGKTAIMVTHDISEAISMSDKVIVISKRPGKVKNIYNIKLSDKSTPINNRKSKDFNKYFDMIWRDLDVHL